MYWPSIRATVRAHVKRCDRCQLGKKRRRQYGKLPSKIAEVVPWRSVCVDCIGPYTLKDKTGTVILDFMCLTMIDPATGWFEIIELPATEVQYVKKGKEIVEVILDKSSACISKLFNKQWLSRYPRPMYIIYDNGSEFKLHFKDLCDSFNIKRKGQPLLKIHKRMPYSSVYMVSLQTCYVPQVWKVQRTSLLRR